MAEQHELIRQQGQLKLCTQKLDRGPLLASVTIACQRLDVDLPNKDIIVKDIISEFPDLTVQEVMKAIRSGSLGEYGKTFKFNTQEVFLWIRSYINSKPLTQEEIKAAQTPGY